MAPAAANRQDGGMDQPFSGTACWIWSDEGAHRARPDDQPYRTRHLRRAFTLDAVAGASAVVHVSADTTYVLWCNGVRVASGPAKGDVAHHFYDTVDLAPHLRRGANAIAAEVVYQGDVWPHYAEGGGNVARMTACPGFVLDGAVVRDGAVLAELHSDRRWRVLVDRSRRWGIVPGSSHCIGLHEVVDCAAVPWGCSEPGFDDAAWVPATETGPATPFPGHGDAMLPHRLMARLAPPPAEAAIAPLPGFAPVTVPPRSRLRLRFDAGVYRTAYPVLRFRGGAGGRLSLIYAEALTPTDGSGRKGRRDAPDGEIRGVADAILPDGPERTWRPLAWRAFRHLALDLETGAEPLTVLALEAADVTALPHLRLEYAASDPGHAAIRDLCWRTVQCCAHETFEDCPYYEQLQYAGDAQVQAMLACYAAGDTALARQFLYQFDWSRGGDGLTRSRYPSRIPQTIPFWSLHWVLAVADHWEMTGDRKVIVDLLPGVRAVCEAVLRCRNPDGTIGRLPGWPVADWCPRWNRPQDGHGVPPGMGRGRSAYASLMTIAAGRAAVDLHAALGEDVGRVASGIAALRDAAQQAYFDPRRGLYRDTPDEDVASAITNVWAILAGMPVDHAALAGRIAGDPTLCPLTMFSQYFANRAFSQAGRYDLCGGSFQLWRDMLEHGFTTCPETVDFATTRSDCHAWGAAPLVEFGREILGVRPAAPGYARIRIWPQPAGLSWARGAVPIPGTDARIRVAWRIGDGGMHLEGEAPAGRPVEVVLPDGAISVFPAGGAFVTPAPSPGTP
jgi:hypothetical protein